MQNKSPAFFAFVDTKIGCWVKTRTPLTWQLLEAIFGFVLTESRGRGVLGLCVLVLHKHWLTFYFHFLDPWWMKNLIDGIFVIYVDLDPHLLTSQTVQIEFHTSMEIDVFPTPRLLLKEQWNHKRTPKRSEVSMANRNLWFNISRVSKYSNLVCLLILVDLQCNWSPLLSRVEWFSWETEAWLFLWRLAIHMRFIHLWT